MTEARNTSGDDEPTTSCAAGRAAGRSAAACWAPITVTTAISTTQANDTRISIPKSRAIGSPPPPPTGRALGRGLQRSRIGVGDPRLERAGPLRRQPRQASASGDDTTPTPIVLSTQNAWGNSWTSFSVAGSNR